MGQKKLALSLRGGGTKCFAYLGYIKALEENNIKPTMIMGSSGGAVIGALYCLGFTIDEVREVFKNFSINDFRSVRGYFRLELLSTSKTRKKILDVIGKKKFEDANIPIFIQATNLTKKQQTIFSKGPLVDAILCSIAIPLLYRPIKIKDEYYIDGGFAATFASEFLRNEGAQVIIGLSTHSNNPTNSLKNPSAIDGFSSAMQILLHEYHKISSIHEKLDYVDLYLNDDLKVVYNTNYLEKSFKIGYKRATDNIKQIKQKVFS